MSAHIRHAGSRRMARLRLSSSATTPLVVSPASSQHFQQWLPSRSSRMSRRLLSTTSAMASDGSATGKTRPPVDWNQFVTMGEGTVTPDVRTFTLAVKDNIVTLGTEFDTTCASGMLQGYESPFEATIVAQMRSRGARIVGKTNLDEFGMGSHNLFSSAGVVQELPELPETEKTEAKSLSVGGSSGGSAVAVRLGDADVALGTDTGGSVRLPAAYGGIVGFKPSYGMLSRFGVVPYANSLDTVGLLAPEVGPIRRLIAGNGGLWKGHDARDPTSLSLKTRLRLASQREGYDGDSKSSAPDEQLPLAGLTFGIPLEYNIAELDPAIRTAWVAAAAQLRRLGATVSAVSLPSTQHALSSYYVLAPAEAASNMARYDGVRYGKMQESVGNTEANPETETETATKTETATEAETVLYERARGAGLGREVQRRILLGAYVLSSTARDNYFLQAQRVRRLVVRDFDAVFRLQNPLRDPEDADTTNSEGYQGYSTAGSAGEDADDHIDLSDLPEGLPLADKRGPARVDFLLCPTAPTPAPTLEDVVAAPSPVDAYINDVFTVPASLAGLPAISIPAPPVSQSSTSTTFCPGLQLIGQFWDDARLLRVAEAVMEASFQHPGDKESLAKHRRTGTSQA
ncbi:glutamyl-trna amidotransferase subunit a [Ophiostoma piceae UAMH 11346]|uniref:Glutamyl-tRNA(Gln) amidotransferase subunit A, mitochondrial n=1 Tax=Ophiostoma piceae (strain UAMH 11346) TaxID=1262450 RepID=S3BV92_OPHP1|nr:glutamyl-trna amidotransferase subunit a [Ophiostoma piceae UAMH 11346]